MEKIYLISTGNQAPYGIGEIIEIVPSRHVQKIRKILGYYYNPPVMRLNGPNGPRMEVKYDDGNKAVGFQPYSI